ncbi:MAG: hypothetical protein R2688_03490 [Fimbriimonadaceae bacterium]
MWLEENPADISWHTVEMGKFPASFIIKDNEREIIRVKGALTDALFALNERLVAVFEENKVDAFISETCHKLMDFGLSTVRRPHVYGPFCIGRIRPYWLSTSLEKEFDIVRICDLGEDVKELVHRCLECEKQILELLENE